jgi:hypothetical protein
MTQPFLQFPVLFLSFVIPSSWALSFAQSGRLKKQGLAFRPVAGWLLISRCLLLAAHRLLIADFIIALDLASENRRAQAESYQTIHLCRPHRC